MQGMLKIKWRGFKRTSKLLLNKVDLRLVEQGKLKIKWQHDSGHQMSLKFLQYKLYLRFISNAVFFCFALDGTSCLCPTTIEQ